MPSFDIVSEVDKQEIDNALNQARKELATRFDLKDAKTEIITEPDKITLIADDGAHLKALREIVIGKLSKRGVDLAKCGAGGTGDLIRRPCTAGIENQARTRREQSQRNYPGNQSHRDSKSKASYRTGRFASQGKRKTNCKPSFNSCAVATSVSPQTLKTSGTEVR